MTDNRSSDEVFFTPAEVCDYLRIHINTLRRWRQDEVGPPYVTLTDRIIRYPKEGLDNWLTENWSMAEADKEDWHD